ncbi:hypothetical protein PYW08_010259 [Mythimna loreyi]|uniref:Uncharacterized protein n=1 Tax=Mythimna loreyi TaxID=667449 RepID=A0ACC2Q6Q8_9NEOP|nr:hypothetical protein PYW08_010259 [Mythimna loreyi]
MDSEKGILVHVFTFIFEKFFNTEGHNRLVRPVHEMSTEELSQPTFGDRITSVLENTTTIPQNGPTNGPATTIHVVNPSGLEKCLWVALGGIAVLILMAFFMKLGKPIRRVRRHLSNTRTSPEDPGASLDMGSNARLVDANEPGPYYNDPPPPYIECITMNQCDGEEPPPRYSASFEDYKNVEPQVHTRQKHNAQDALSENAVRVELIAKKDDIVRGKKTELVFDNGRIVERQLSLSTILNIGS